jgi:two-component system, LytTR family, response regulator
MTVRVLVVDDEPAARSGMSRLVAATPGFEVAGEAGDGEAAVERITTLRPDLVLLDIAMPGCDGFEVVRRVGPARMPAVVFVTAHDEWALRAFDVHALGYVLKPFEDARLRAALVRAAAARHGAALAAALESLIAPPPQPSPAASLEPRFEVRAGTRVLLVPVTDVDWIEGAGYYSMLHVGGETHLLRETMQALEQRLDPARFLRVHRSAIIQLPRVRELRDAASEVVLQSGAVVPVSRSRRAALSAALGTARRRTSI